tara:strand:- start:1375 stop:3216 length:1842 start_codon:yes stop_codon:yes gene_type:complete
MMKKKELLNEIMGVPKALTPWVNALSQIVFDDVNKMVDWDEQGPVNYVKDGEDGEEVEGMAYRLKKKEISGKDVMESIVKNNGFSDLKEFISSDMFIKLPLWRPNLSYNLVGVPTELYKLEGDGKMNASVSGEIDQELKKIGKHMVFPGVTIHLDMLVDSDDPLANLKNHMSDTIAHELLHTYQKVKQLESGKPSHFGKEMVLNAIVQNPMVTNVELQWWEKFLNLIYLHLSFEVNARVTQLYYLLKEKDINTKEDFLVELKKSTMWSQMKELEDFNAVEYIKSFKLPNAFTDGRFNPLEMLSNISKKINLERNGVNQESEEEALKSLIDLWDKTLDVGNKGMKSLGVGVTMDNVPKSAKENPLKFFKFFEKRFHKKAEKWKKKLYRVGSLLLQEKEEYSQKEKIGESLLKEERVINFSKPNNNFVLIAGGPGVGKSFITNNLINLNNIKLFNVDQVRVMMAKKLWGNDWSENMSTPEGYQKILDLTHTTSDPRNLTVKFLKNFLQQERKEGVNVLYDAGGGQKETMEEVLGLAKDNGFHTTLVYVRTPLEISQKRNAERPRSLPFDMVSSYHEKVKNNIRHLIDGFDSVWFVDNKDLIDISNRPTDNIEKVK